ncbi:MAG TPA: FAD-dependent oxidoreductase [Polyangiaceae bacterium]|jgi:NADPH-dependent glutamate synthase beta subunit-like oxidoreductase/NAD(P)H-flavin reductase
MTDSNASTSVHPGDDPSEIVLGLEGFAYADLYDPAKLDELHRRFDRWFSAESPEHHGRFAAYRACQGEGMTPVARSEALLAAAPYVGRFVGLLFGVDDELEVFREKVRSEDPIWKFRRDFLKKRVLRAGAGKGWTFGADRASAVARAALQAMTAAPIGGTTDEELTIAVAALPLIEVDEVARKAAKAGGAHWTEELRARARACLARVGGLVPEEIVAGDPASLDDDALGRGVALSLEAVEAWLAARKADGNDPARRWPSMHVPKTLDYARLVDVIHPEPGIPELSVGPHHDRRERLGFLLTDRRMGRREVEAEIEYCMLCHDRDKDSCSKGMVDAKTGGFKKNPLGVALAGCPLEEKIGEMHAMRQAGELLAAMAIITIDNPMCPGTGHRICNDCMKACIFQKQEPVNIPQVETRVLTETLSLPWGLEIYQLLTRWNPLHVARPAMRPYNGRNVLVVGLGPAGYTLAHHLACEGFGVAAVDGLKVEPLDPELVGGPGRPPRPVKWASTLFTELDERRMLGFGGVSEYGITVRWDKNFLTIVYLTLARNRHVQVYGGIRFGGTLTLEDAWAMGFDHVAISAGAGRPTIIDMKNNLARGIRKASDFLMALQLTGAYKKTSIANLQVSLPAIVIGGGLTAIDTATELLAYYQVQLEKELDRYELLVRGGRTAAEVRAMFDDEEWETLERHLAHARALRDEKKRAAAEGREPRVQKLLDAWGGVTLVYRKGIVDSPAYRLNHEEVAKSLEEGIRYMEHLSPLEALLDERHHVKGLRFQRADGTTLDLPARTVCVAAGTSPNVIYEKEYPGTFELDDRKQYFRPYVAKRDDAGQLVLERAKTPAEGFFTSYLKDGHTVSFYGDNHPHYAGSVVKAMASGKDGYSRVVALFPEAGAGAQPVDVLAQAARDRALEAFFAKLDGAFIATVHEVNRLTKTIVEIVVHAPMAARKFQPGQFYRLQNFETYAQLISLEHKGDGNGTPDIRARARLAMEGLALTGAWVDVEKGLLGTIVLEMGGSSRLCAALKPGEPIVLMGPTGQPTHIEKGETVLLCGGGLGNAVLFSIARAFKALGGRVLYFGGYRRGEDLFKRDDIEGWTDQVIWCTDGGAPIDPRRPQDKHFRGNIVQAMYAYATGKLGGPPAIPFKEVARIIAIGSDGMMNAVREARHDILAPLLDPRHLAIGSINSPMQCMMKEVCAQCLQKLRDPVTGKERVVFTCFNQDQDLDAVDFPHLRQRLRANSMQEKLSNTWLDELLNASPEVIRV